MTTINEQAEPHVADTPVSVFLEIPEHERDLSTLKGMLQAAIKVEMSTIPPYLCAYWSIEDQGHPGSRHAATVLGEIALEEMVHMGTAANLLCAVGGTVDIKGSCVNYPGPVPGGVIPGLTLELRGLNREIVKSTFMRIEQPRKPLYRDSYYTIGEFYDAVIKLVNKLDLTYSTDKQISVDVGGGFIQPISNRREAVDALNTIKEDGEGTSTEPGQDTVLAHYYRFRELYEGRSLRKVDGRWKYEGPAVPFPAKVHPMGPVPVGGWQKSKVPGEVWTLVEQFRKDYRSVVDNLDSAWREGGDEKLKTAVEMMEQLRSTAVELMRWRIPNNPNGYTYGPDFRIS